MDFAKNDIFLQGDFNIDYLDRLSENTKRLKSTLKKYGLSQKLMLALDSLKTKTVKNCDHKLIAFTKKKIKIKTEKIPFKGRSYVNYDKDLILQRLSDYDWDEINELDNPTDMWNYLIQKIKEILNEMCPLKGFRVKNSGKPWITNELLEQIKDKDRALRRAKKSNNPEHWKIARRLRNG